MKLNEAIAAYQSERDWNNGQVPEYVHTLASAAQGHLPKQGPLVVHLDAKDHDELVKLLTGTFERIPGFEVDVEEGGGQPNGIGEIESNDSREWFLPDGETHHRVEIFIRGPWIEGPTEVQRARRELKARQDAARAEALAAKKWEDAPAKALEEVAIGLYSAHRLRTGISSTLEWGQLNQADRETFREQANDLVNGVRTV